MGRSTEKRQKRRWVYNQPTCSSAKNIYLKYQTHLCSDDSVSKKLFICATRNGAVVTQLENGKNMPYKMESIETQCTVQAKNLIFIGSKTAIHVFMRRPRWGMASSCHHLSWWHRYVIIMWWRHDRYADMRVLHLQDIKCSPVKMLYDRFRKQLVVLCDDKTIRCFDLRMHGEKWVLYFSVSL